MLLLLTSISGDLHAQDAEASTPPPAPAAEQVSVDGVVDDSKIADRLSQIVRSSRDEVVSSIKRALDAAEIEIPFPYRTLTFQNPAKLASILGQQHQETTP